MMTNTLESRGLEAQKALGAAEAPRESPRRLTDEDLLRLYKRDGDTEAFDELVRRYEGELYNYLRRYLGNAAMAEDAFQTTFLQLHLKCDQFEEGRRVRPWLYTIATNQAIDAQRRSKRRRMVSLDRRRGEKGAESGSLAQFSASEDPGPHDKMEAQERGSAVREAVDALPEGLRAAVNLIYYQGLKYREAAEILGVPVGTVKSRMHSAIQRLGESFSRSEFAEHG